MKKVFNYAVLAVVGLMTAMCTTTPAQTGDQEEEIAGKLYDFKSAIIEMKLDATDNAETVVSTNYIDDYGRISANYVKYISKDSINVSYQIADTMYIVPAGSTTGFKNVLPQQQEWLNKTDEELQSSNLKRLGQKEFLGKMCEVYAKDATTVEEGKAEVDTIYVWKGFVVKRYNRTANSLFSVEATSIQENVEIPAEKITLPKDMEFIGYGRSAQADSTKTAE